MVVIPIVFDVIGTVIKSLENKLEEVEIRKRIMAIQTTALKRVALNIKCAREALNAKLTTAARIKYIRNKIHKSKNG